MKWIGVSFHKKVFGMRCDGQPGISYFTHHDFPGLQMEPFSFQNKKGNTLRGGIFSYDIEKKEPLIIFFHGMGGGYTAYMTEIELLCQAGYRVLTYDYTGTFSSDGEDLGGFCQSISDADDALSYIKKLFPQTPLYVMGHSWGGFTAGCMVNLHSDVEKAVLLAPPVSMSVMYHQLAPAKMIAESLIEVEQEKYPDYWEQSILKDFSKESKTKVMIVQSTDDKMVNYEKNCYLLQQQEQYNSVNFLIVENKDHNPNYTEEAVAYKEAYLKKLREARNDAEIDKLQKTAQWRKMCQQDRAIMDQILNFLES